MNKKDIAISFLHLASSGKVREAYEKYVHPDFHHHNPYFKGDAQSLMTAMEENAIKDHWLYGCLRRYAELVPAQVEARPEKQMTAFEAVGVFENASHPPSVRCATRCGFRKF